MLDSLKHLYMIDLLCDGELTGFYERMGMDKAKGIESFDYIVNWDVLIPNMRDNLNNY